MNTYYKISAPAKLNLNLFVRDKISDGLHFLDSDICFLKLIDTIYLKFNKEDTFYQNKNNSFIINPKKNLILQAIKLYLCFFFHLLSFLILYIFKYLAHLLSCRFFYILLFVSFSPFLFFDTASYLALSFIFFVLIFFLLFNF